MLNIISMLVKASQTIKSENRTKELNKKAALEKNAWGKNFLISFTSI